MHTIKLIIVITIAAVSASFARNEPQQYESFLKYLTNNFKFPEATKKNCEWHYLMIKVSVNSANKIVRYECLNKVDDSEKNGLDLLLNYTFPPSDHLNNHPLIMMLSLDKSEICNYDLPYHIYTPTNAINIYTSYISAELKKDPKVNIIWSPAEIKYGATQH